MILVLQLILYCALFFFILLCHVRKNGSRILFFYPPEFQSEAVSRGVVDNHELHRRMAKFVVPFFLIMGAALVAIIAWWNGADSFWPAYGQAVLFLLVVNWFDGIVLDGIWIGKSHRFDMPELKDVPHAYKWKTIITQRLALSVVCAIVAFAVAGIVVLVG